VGDCGIIAVGDCGIIALSDEQLLKQALHWNGKRWSQVHTPNPGGSGKGLVQALEGVRCSAAKNCWAVGTCGDISPGQAMPR
jgi:hypothetical protein